MRKSTVVEMRRLLAEIAEISRNSTIGPRIRERVTGIRKILNDVEYEEVIEVKDCGAWIVDPNSNPLKGLLFKLSTRSIKPTKVYLSPGVNLGISRYTLAAALDIPESMVQYLPDLPDPVDGRRTLLIVAPEDSVDKILTKHLDINYVITKQTKRK